MKPDETDDRVSTSVEDIQRELNAFPTWSDAAVRDAVQRVVEATPDELLEDLEEHYDDRLVVCADCAANPAFQRALEAFGGTLVGTCGHVSRDA